ncbi:MAG: DUF6338 family protein [Candidatus Amoebophilus sp.]
MDIFTFNKFIAFTILFLPGFVSIKVYDLLIANEPRDFSKSVLEAVAYSTINLAALSWFIWPLLAFHIYISYPLLFGLAAFVILFLCPALWPILYIKLIKSKWLAGRIIDPVKRPWDWFFNQKQPVWVIVTLTDGRKIGGIFFDKSYVSSYPLPEQIYLEEAWELDENNRFKQAAKGTKGVIIIGKDISTLEFFGE